MCFQGVQLLYEFISSHPGSDAQVQDHLRLSTPFYKSYVERSLAECARNDPKNAIVDPAPPTTTTTTVVSNSQPAACLGRLQEFRSKIGLAPVQVREYTERKNVSLIYHDSFFFRLP